MLMARIRGLLWRLRAYGLRRTGTYGVQRFYDVYMERRLGIRSADSRLLREFGITNPACHSYSPTSFLDFRSAMNRLRLAKGKDVFLDYGSGMGRMVIAAAMCPFRKVIGVEIAPELNAIAAENLRRARGKLRCQDVELVTCDATAYALPSDVTVIFFFNPFSGDVLKAVFENIRRSLRKSPRKLTVIYRRPEVFEQEIGQCDWLVKRHEFTGIYRNVIFQTPDPAGAGLNPCLAARD